MAQFKTQKFTFFAPRTVIFYKKVDGYLKIFSNFAYYSFTSINFKP